MNLFNCCNFDFFDWNPDGAGRFKDQFIIVTEVICLKIIYNKSQNLEKIGKIKKKQYRKPNVTLSLFFINKIRKSTIMNKFPHGKISQ